MNDQSRFHVGQTVWMSNWRMRRDPQEVTIVKTARKYATISRYGREEKFDLVTGRAPGESGWFIETTDDLAEKRARVAALERLREVGVRSAHDLPRGLTTAALLRIADVIADDLRTPPREAGAS